MKEKFNPEVDFNRITLKIQYMAPSLDPNEVNRNHKKLRDHLKCSWWRFHKLQKVPDEGKVFEKCKEKTVQHHKVSIHRFLKLTKYYCQKCQTIFYKEE